MARRVCSSSCRLRTWRASTGCARGPASSASTANTSREAAAKAWVTSCTREVMVRITEQVLTVSSAVGGEDAEPTC